MHDIETVQQQARARGMRIRIESGYVVEEELFTLLDTRDMPTALRDVSLAVIAERLAQPRATCADLEGWHPPPPPPKPAHQEYIRPTSEHWRWMEMEAKRRFRQDGVPFNRGAFARELQTACRTKFGWAPANWRKIRRHVSAWAGDRAPSPRAAYSGPAPITLAGTRAR